MSDEYRRVLREWAKRHLPDGPDGARIVDIEIRFFAGHVWSEVTIDDPYVWIHVKYLDHLDRKRSRIICQGEDDQEAVEALTVTAPLTQLLKELFQLADVLPRDMVSPGVQAEVDRSS